LDLGWAPRPKTGVIIREREREREGSDTQTQRKSHGKITGA
jgi:hypothetical protein